MEYSDHRLLLSIRSYDSYFNLFPFDIINEIIKYFHVYKDNRSFGEFIIDNEIVNYSYFETLFINYYPKL